MLLYKWGQNTYTTNIIMGDKEQQLTEFFGGYYLDYKKVTGRYF